MLGIASGPGNLAVLLGSSTGRDGIGGVSVLASAGFAGDDGRRRDGGDDTKRPSVQVGDPFEEKRLIEACLELLDKKLVVGIQDLGGAGLACATSETAGRGGVGMDVDVSAVPRREDGHGALGGHDQREPGAHAGHRHPGRRGRRWRRSAPSGRCGPPSSAGSPRPTRRRAGRLRIRDGFDGPVLADVPAASLSDDAPLYDRPRRPPGRGGRGRRPGRRRPTTARPTCWRLLRSTRAGSSASTTTSCS